MTVMQMIVTIEAETAAVVVAVASVAVVRGTPKPVHFAPPIMFSVLTQTVADVMPSDVTTPAEAVMRLVATTKVGRAMLSAAYKVTRRPNELVSTKS